MKSLDQMARDYDCFERSDTNVFQRKARLMQAMWRDAIGYPVGKHRGQKLGSVLPMPWAEQVLANFLDEDIRDVVSEVLSAESSKGKGSLIEPNRLFGNLLSSQPLAFNLFAHLRRDLDLASKVLGEMSGGRVGRVEAVEFEFSPGRGDACYTGDRSAFDVYVRFATPDGAAGFVGIEVKYHENMADKPSAHHDRYDEVSDMMGCFYPQARPLLREMPIQQIWRDHMLAGIHREVDGFDDGFFVFLSPAGNMACSRAVEAYRRCLSCEETFAHWTLEALAQAIQHHCDRPWVAAFIDRYLAFEKIDNGLSRK